MRPRLPLPALLLVPPLALLAACQARTGPQRDGADKDAAAGKPAITASIGDGANAATGKDGVSIDTPVFSARVKLPLIDLDSGHVDLDGMKLYPGSRVTGVDMDSAGDSHKGRVEIAFTSPDAPDRLLAYYRQAARDDGFAVSAPGTGPGGETVLDGARDAGAKGFHLVIGPDGAGTKGSILLIGD